jgi:hypothetical protein
MSIFVIASRAFAPGVAICSSTKRLLHTQIATAGFAGLAMTFSQ